MKDFDVHSLPVNFRAHDISPTEIENTEMEIIFLKNNLEILTRRLNMLCSVLEITHTGVLDG